MNCLNKLLVEIGVQTRAKAKTFRIKVSKNSISLNTRVFFLGFVDCFNL